MAHSALSSSEIATAAKSGRIESVQAEENPTQLTHPTLAFFRRYWDDKRGSRVMPARSDVLPREMKEHLGWIVLVDVFPDLSDFRYRLVGSRVTQYFLRDGTGKTIKQAFGEFGEGATKAALAIHRKTARDRIAMRAYGGAGWLGRGYLDFDAIYLPLSDDGGDHVNMILSCFTFDSAKLREVRGEADALKGLLEALKS